MGTLSLALFGFGIAFFLVFQSQDLRQRAAFFNLLGGSSSSPGALSTLVLDGLPVDQIDLRLTQEEPRKFPTIIFANGTNNQAVQVTLSLGDTAVWTILFSSLETREWQVPPGSYTLTVHQPNTKFSDRSTSLFQTTLLVPEKSIIVVTRNENGSAGGAIGQHTLVGNDIPQARAFNLSQDSSVRLFGGTLDQLTNAEITLPAATTIDPLFAPRTQARFTLISALPGLQRRDINILNLPLHRLFFFVLGNEKSAQLSVVTVPLPLTEADLKAQSLATLPIDYTLTDYETILKTGSPRDQYQQIESLIRPRQQAIRLWALTDLSNQDPWLGRLNMLIDRTGAFVVWAKLDKLTPHLDNTTTSTTFELVAATQYTPANAAASTSATLENATTIGTVTLQKSANNQWPTEAYLTTRTTTDLLARPYWFLRRQTGPNQYEYIAQGAAPKPE